MLTVFIRTVFLFIVIILVMRLMGKRQIGQLQPAELVVTILLSEVAATPMQDRNIPLLYSLLSLLLLTGFELLLSFVTLKNSKVRTVLQGNSVEIIKDGNINYDEIKKLRYSMDDILEALRQKDIFDISQVEYAVAETNGSLSVLLKPAYRVPSAADLRVRIVDTGVPKTIIVDGEVLQTGLQECGMTQAQVGDKLKKKKLTVDQVLLMTCDESGRIVLFGKDGKQC